MYTKLKFLMKLNSDFRGKCGILYLLYFRSVKIYVGDCAIAILYVEDKCKINIPESIFMRMKIRSLYGKNVSNHKI